MLEDKTYLDINNYSKRKFANIKNKINFNENNKHFANNNKNNENKKYFNNILLENILLRKVSILFYYNIIIVILFYTISQVNCKKRKILSYYSSVHLKVNPGNPVQILYQIFYNKFPPNEIIINGNVRTDKQYSYQITNTDSNVTISWNNKLNSTYQMFEGCTDIIEIDFSDFDSSQVTQMNEMFVNCMSLRSINFGNFKTSKVKIMDNMFVLCSALISLDLSSFDTSKVET